jgi:hypothetical protein
LPAKTNTEHIVEILKDVATLKERTEADGREISRLDLRLNENDRKLWHLTIVLFGSLLSLITAIIAGIFLFLIRQ